MSYCCSVTKIGLISEELYSNSYTSNVYKMLQCCLNSLQSNNIISNNIHHWSDEINYGSNPKNYIKQLILELKSNPNKYIEYNPENGWGDYYSLIDWLVDIHSYLDTLDLQNIVYEVQVSW